MFPVSHEASSSVAVCGAESALVHVIVSPTAAVASAGAKAKFSIPTVTAPGSLDVVQPPPPAVGALAAGSLPAGAAVGAVVAGAAVPPVLDAQADSASKAN